MACRKGPGVCARLVRRVHNWAQGLVGLQGGAPAVGPAHLLSAQQRWVLFAACSSAAFVLSSAFPFFISHGGAEHRGQGGAAGHGDDELIAALGLGLH